MAIGNPIRPDGHFADLSDQGDRDALEHRNRLRDLAESMVVKFADYWKEETGHYPARLLFDWRATTYASLSQLTQRRAAAPDILFTSFAAFLSRGRTWGCAEFGGIREPNCEL